jgi:Cu(I)/Ag(I) efflux system membrane fusion protein
MYRLPVPTVLLATMVLGWGLLGCSSTPTNSNGKPAAGQSADPHGDHADHPHGEHADHDGDHADHAQDGQSDMEKMNAELAKLPPEDAASAQRQHICPVSGEMLGTMGPPKKVDVSGRQVWICCDDCQDKLLADPDKYLAKLPKE